MPISKRHVPTRELLGAYLTFTPRSHEVDLLDKDMRTLNPTLLRDAIREATEIRKLRLVPPDAQRSLVHQIYTRKIKEFSAIYPFLFAVENGLRSALAEQSAIKFNGVHWWTLIRDARARGQTAQALPTIWTIPVSAAFLKAVWRAFDTIANPLHVQSVSDRVAPMSFSTPSTSATCGTSSVQTGR